MGVTVAMQDHRVNYVIKERNIYEKRSVRDVHKVDKERREAWSGESHICTGNTIMANIKREGAEGKVKAEGGNFSLN